LDRIHADLLADLDQDASQDRHGGEIVHDTSDCEQEHIQGHEQRNVVAGQPGKEPGNLVRHLLQRDQPSETIGRHEDKHHDGGGAQRTREDPRQSLYLQLAIAQESDRERIDNGDDGGFGRRNDAAIDAA
jgi:hypothetical protein